MAFRGGRERDLGSVLHVGAAHRRLIALDRKCSHSSTIPDKTKVFSIVVLCGGSVSSADSTSGSECQKRPITVSKKTCYSVKRDLS